MHTNLLFSTIVQNRQSKDNVSLILHGKERRLAGEEEAVDTSKSLSRLLQGKTQIGWDVMDWIDQAQDRDQWRALVNTVMNLSGSIKYWEVLE
jgi:esterase/lipase superfamily enzyme